ncbi:GntR family transcriptional regulator [Terrarubrum flagellatum]|uniref:GntR family transcriptional regulator n=1 Tax=Terrirubrum flagellatum TaxID=2895980 RepID=UPI0031456A91
MPRAASPTHSETVRLAIEREIFEGALAPGAPLDEESIARRFEVSRTPVREAMLQLVQSGLVEKRPRQGAFVARTDVRHMIQKFEVMSELEGLCAKFAARRMSASERKEIEDTHNRSAAALAAGDDDAYYTLSRRFHLQVIDGTHNDVLIEMTNKLGIMLVPYRRFQLRYPGRREANLKDHDDILKAIFNGDSETAYALFRKHTTVQGDVLADYISQPDAAPQRVAAQA